MWIGYLEREIASLKKREGELKTQLLVFDIGHMDSMDLIQLEQVCLSLVVSSNEA